MSGKDVVWRSESLLSSVLSLWEVFFLLLNFSNAGLGGHGIAHYQSICFPCRKFQVQTLASSDKKDQVLGSLKLCLRPWSADTNEKR